MTEEDIQKLADEYVDDKFSFKMPSNQLLDTHPVETTVAEVKGYCRGDYIAGIKKAMELWKGKADNWDALYEEVSKCYCNKDGEYDEENPEIEGADLCTIGEIAACALGWG